MFDLNEYLGKLIAACQAAFANRLLYVGLQGSYLRGEATEDSDIDIMIVLDGFSVRDMDIYRNILETVGYADKACGFICGRDELTRWSPLEVCQLRYTTKDLYGQLAGYLPDASREDEIHYVKISLGNLYHALCHRYIHRDRTRNIQAFRGVGKALFFLIQNIYFLESGQFVTTKKALQALAGEEDRRVLTLTELTDDADFDEAFAAVFAWCQNAFRRMDQMK